MAETEAGADAAVVVVDSVTILDERHRGTVLVGGSHGGVIAGYLAAKAGVRAVILSDAGVGKDRAGIASLAYLERIGMAAATVGHMTARIADGADMLARGVITHANRVARQAGVAAGQPCRQAAALLEAAPMPAAPPPDYAEARFPLRQVAGEPEVWGLDSASLAAPEDAGRIVVAGSHGGLLAGRPDAAFKVDVLGVVFNDAGVGIDGAGIKRLAVLDGRAIAAAAVDCATARIGDARSLWETGTLSHVNQTAAGAGIGTGMSVPDFADHLIDRQP